MIPLGRMMEWLIEQKGWVAAVIAVGLLVAVLIMRYEFDRWWSAGIVMATIFGLIAVINSKS